MMFLPAMTDTELVTYVNQIGPQSKVEEALLERLEELAECSAIVDALDDCNIDTKDAVTVRRDVEAAFDLIEKLENELITLHEKINELMEG
jgi:hypothetical protein